MEWDTEHLIWPNFSKKSEFPVLTWARGVCGRICQSFSGCPQKVRVVTESPESRLQAHVCPNTIRLLWPHLDFKFSLLSDSATWARTKVLLSFDPTEINRVQLEHIHVDNRIGKIISPFWKIGNKNFDIPISLEHPCCNVGKKSDFMPKNPGGERIVGDPYIGRSSRHELLLRRGSSVNHCGDAWQDDRNFSKQSDKSEQGVVSQARCNTNRRASQPLKFPWSSFIELRRQAREQNALRHFLITPFLFLARNTRGTFGPGSALSSDIINILPGNTVRGALVFFLFHLN